MRRRSRARLAHVSRKFIFRASPSDRAGRYFRATRAHVPDYFLIYETGSGRLAPSPGALPFARARPARSARSSHTPCPPVPPATPPRSTRTCAQDGLGLEEWPAGAPSRLAAASGSKAAACKRIRLVGRLARLRAPRRWSHGRWVSRSGARAREREREESGESMLERRWFRGMCAY